MIFGLSFATLLTLLLVPIMYLLSQGFKERLLAKIKKNKHNEQEAEPIGQKEPAESI